MRLSSRRLGRVVLPMVGMAIVACSGGNGSSTPPPPPPPTTAGGTSTTGGGGVVAGGGGTSEDAGQPLDGGGGTTDAGMASCDIVELGTIAAGLAPDAAFALAGGIDDGLVAYVEAGDENRLVARHLGPTGTVGEEVELVVADATVQHPAIAWRDDYFQVVWSDNSDLATGFELYGAVFDGSGVRSGDVVRITSSEAGDTRPTVAPFGDGTLLVWHEFDFPNQRARRLLLSTSGNLATASTALSGLDGVGPNLDVHRFGDGAAVVVRSGEDAQLHVLNATGDVAAAPTTNLNSGAISASTDFTIGPRGGGFVYDTILGGSRLEVNFTSVETDGDREMPKTIVTRTPEQGAGSSITSLAGGFVIGYVGRDGVEGEPTFRVAFLGEFGDVLTRSTLGDAASMLGRTRVRVTSGGQVFVVWLDVDGESASLGGVRLQCGEL